MRKEHGSNLTSSLILQPGSKFKSNKRGFDTGSRTYKCDSSLAHALAPRIGDADSIYTSMYVSDVDITEGRAGLSTIVVSYEGAISISGKADHVEYSTTDQVDSLTADDGNVFSLSLPTVTHYYVTKTFPSTSPGEYLNPPRYSERLPKELSPRQLRPINSGTGDIWDTHFFTGSLLTGWRLMTRSFSESGPALSIVDVYSYYIKVTGVGYRDGSSSPINGA